MWFGSKIAHFQTDDSKGSYVFLEEEESVKVGKKIIVRQAAFQLNSSVGIITIVLASIGTLFSFVLLVLFFEYSRKLFCCRGKRIISDEENPEQDIAMDEENEVVNNEANSQEGEVAGEEGNIEQDFEDMDEINQETLDEEENKSDESHDEVDVKTRENGSIHEKENIELKEFKISSNSEIKSVGENTEEDSETILNNAELWKIE